MAQLLMFHDLTHTYEVDGETLPSVSEIIRFISREVYGSVTQYTLDNACDRGKKVHKFCENLDKFGTVDCDEDLAAYVEAYMNFLKDHTVEWSIIEQSMYHKEQLYAGTIDRVGKVDGKLSIVDIKTSCVIHKPLVTAQINAYAEMYEDNNADIIEQLIALQLKSDGTYKIHEIEIDSTAFTACLTLHGVLKKKGKVKK